MKWHNSCLIFLQTMPEENATSTYVIAEPFDEAVKLVRKVLAGAHLRITGEMNMSERLQRALLVQPAPCLVLFASPAVGPEGEAVSPHDAAVAPLHVVLAARGSETEVHLLRVLPRHHGKADLERIAASGRLQAAIAQAIESIGMRKGLGV